MCNRTACKWAGYMHAMRTGEETEAYHYQKLLRSVSHRISCSMNLCGLHKL